MTSVIWNLDICLAIIDLGGILWISLYWKNAQMLIVYSDMLSFSLLWFCPLNPLISFLIIRPNWKVLTTSVVTIFINPNLCCIFSNILFKLGWIDSKRFITDQSPLLQRLYKIMRRISTKIPLDWWIHFEN